MSLVTPTTVEKLRKALHVKAKEEVGYRFYLLYDKIYRRDVLSHAYALSRAARGAPGVDGETFAGIESHGLEAWHSAPVRDLDELTVEQRSFLGGVAARIPRLIEAVQAGNTTARFKLGSRRLDEAAGILNSNWSRGCLKASGMGSPDPGGRYRRDSRRTKGRIRSTPVGWAVEPNRSDVEKCLHRRASSCAAIWGGDSLVRAHRAGAAGGRKRV